MKKYIEEINHALNVLESLNGGLVFAFEQYKQVFTNSKVFPITKEFIEQKHQNIVEVREEYFNQQLFQARDNLDLLTKSEEEQKSELLALLTKEFPEIKFTEKQASNFDELLKTKQTMQSQFRFKNGDVIEEATTILSELAETVSCKNMLSEKIKLLNHNYLKISCFGMPNSVGFIADCLHEMPASIIKYIKEELSDSMKRSDASLKAIAKDKVLQQEEKDAVNKSEQEARYVTQVGINCAEEMSTRIESYNLGIKNIYKNKILAKLKEIIHAVPSGLASEVLPANSTVVTKEELIIIMEACSYDSMLINVYALCCQAMDKKETLSIYDYNHSKIIMAELHEYLSDVAHYIDSKKDSAGNIKPKYAEIVEMYARCINAASYINFETPFGVVTVTQDGLVNNNTEEFYSIDKMDNYKIENKQVTETIDGKAISHNIEDVAEALNRQRAKNASSQEKVIYK